MLKNKKGFTLVELTAVIILLVVIITMATLNYMSSYNNGKISSFVDEAFVISEGAINKYSDDRFIRKEDITYKRLYNDNLNSKSKEVVMYKIGYETVSLYKRVS